MPGCKLGDSTLVILGKCFTNKTLHTLPKELDPFEITSKSHNNTIAFFGELNPLSSFHEAFFEADGTKFHSSRQYIQYAKASYFGDSNTSIKIQAAASPAKCKYLSKSIQNYNKHSWEDVAKQQCAKGIRQKFSQNPYLMEVLAKQASKY